MTDGPDGAARHPVSALGCVADDFTGATDLANNLTKRGFRTTVHLGVPTDTNPPEDHADAFVVALKSRTAPAAEAVRQSLAALAWLQRSGCGRFYFKYCSTFDSTPAGNIGPVTDALLDALNEPATIMCPAFPDNGRTVYQGHLFVHEALLNESGMQHHPLTPMTDANLRRVLGAQTASRVALIPLSTIRTGTQHVRERLQALMQGGARMIIADATSNDDLIVLAEASRDLTLITGGSGLALGLRSAGQAGAPPFPPATGARLILAGSASQATLAQIEHARQHLPHLKIDPFELHRDEHATLARAEAWLHRHVDRTAALVYASGTPEEVRNAQAVLGTREAAQLIERALGEIARRAVERGVRQLIVAGGETSGAVLDALDLRHLTVGPEIDPGVPWMSAQRGGDRIHVALKSGNFGARDFFTRAWEVLT